MSTKRSKKIVFKSFLSIPPGSDDKVEEIQEEDIKIKLFNRFKKEIDCSTLNIIKIQPIYNKDGILYKDLLLIVDQEGLFKKPLDDNFCASLLYNMSKPNYIVGNSVLFSKKNNITINDWKIISNCIYYDDNLANINLEKRK